MSRREASASVFHAIADPTRRALLDLLSEGERPVHELAAHFEMTLSAVSQHLKVLREVGLVSERREGRQRLYRFHPEHLGEVAEWVRQHYERFWRERLSALGQFMDAQAAVGTAKKKEDES
jgi:DNA-binding transcriptional ArsR family regulator